MIRAVGGFVLLVAGLAVIGSLLNYNLLTDLHRLLNWLFSLSATTGRDIAPHVKHALHNLLKHAHYAGQHPKHGS